MATFTKIASQTISTPANVVTFSSIPQTYTDLKILISARSSSVDAFRENLIIGFNSQVSNTGYSWIGMYSYLTGTGSNKNPAAYRIIGDLPSNPATSNTFSNSEIYIPSYTSATPHTFLGESVVENNGFDAFLSWSGVLFNGGSEAITSVSIFCASSGATNFVANSTFELYGIKNS